MNRRDPDQVFHRIALAFRHENGLIYVADRGSHEVRIFDASGALVARFGGPGGGEQGGIGISNAISDSPARCNWRGSGVNDTGVGGVGVEIGGGWAAG
jgi:hypothetical protein